MTSTYSSFLAKSIIFLALVMMAMGASLYMGKNLGKSIMELTRRNLDQKFQGELPMASSETSDYVLGAVGGRSEFGFDTGSFGNNPFPRQWADPGEEELAMVEGEEATVEMEVLDTPQSSDTPVDESLSVETSEETTTSPPTERPTAEPPQTDVIFRIQVGTFDQRENAENVWRRLTQAGFDARISTYTENEQVRYRVQVGDFQTQDAANRVAEELRGMNFSAWVFPVG